MALNKLKKLGLNRNEAGIYLALLDLKECQAGLLSKKAQINRTTTYDALERLIEKGLVKYIIHANRKLFQPVNPEVLLKNIQAQEKIAKEILPGLQKRFKNIKEKEESSIYCGKKGIKSILQDILKHKEYLAFGSRGKFLEIMKHDFIAFQKRKKELKINSKVILSESAKNSEQVKIAYAKFRFIPDEFSSPTTTFIYGNQAVIIIWGETPIATLIKSKEVRESYSNYFKFLWGQAKP